MKKIVAEWQDYCEGKSNFDKSHFYSIFKEDLNEEELKKVLSYFPSSEEIFSNFFFKLSKEGSAWSEQDIELLIKKDIDAKSAILRCAGMKEIAVEISDFPMKLVSDPKEFWDELASSDYNASYSSVLFDYFITNLSVKEPKYYILIEALYQYLGDYNLVWFYISPLLFTNVPLDTYVTLSCLRVKYGIGNESILIYRHPI